MATPVLMIIEDLKAVSGVTEVTSKLGKTVEINLDTIPEKKTIVDTPAAGVLAVHYQDEKVIDAEFTIVMKGFDAAWHDLVGGTETVTNVTHIKANAGMGELDSLTLLVNDIAAGGGKYKLSAINCVVKPVKKYGFGNENDTEFTYVVQKRFPGDGVDLFTLEPVAEGLSL